MRFGQLIEYNTRKKLFLKTKNHTQNVVEKLVPGSFLKNEKRAYLWINGLNFYLACLNFYCMPS